MPNALVFFLLNNLRLRKYTNQKKGGTEHGKANHGANPGLYRNHDAVGRNKKEPCWNRALMNSRMPGFLGRVIRYGRHHLCVAPSDYGSDSSAWLMVVPLQEFP